MTLDTEFPEAPRLTEDQAADYLTIDPNTLRKVLRANKIPKEYTEDGDSYTVLQSTIADLFNRWEELVSPHCPPAGTYVTARQAAKEAGVTRQAVYIWAKQGKVNIMDNGSKVKVRLEDVEKIVDARSAARTRAPEVVSVGQGRAAPESSVDWENSVARKRLLGVVGRTEVKFPRPIHPDTAPKPEKGGTLA